MLLLLTLKEIWEEIMASARKEVNIAVWAGEPWILWNCYQQASKSRSQRKSRSFTISKQLWLSLVVSTALKSAEDGEQRDNSSYLLPCHSSQDGDDPQVKWRCNIPNVMSKHHTELFKVLVRSLWGSGEIGKGTNHLCKNFLGNSKQCTLNFDVKWLLKCALVKFKSSEYTVLFTVWRPTWRKTHFIGAELSNGNEVDVSALIRIIVFCIFSSALFSFIWAKWISTLRSFPYTSETKYFTFKTIFQWQKERNVQV